eukprot:m.19923 g.19923  ORF g.19923 m.19923 type:complete len:320 (-) comp10977_c0_seq1:44-1003(-)
MHRLRPFAVPLQAFLQSTTVSKPTPSQFVCYPRILKQKLTSFSLHQPAMSHTVITYDRRQMESTHHRHDAASHRAENAHHRQGYSERRDRYDDRDRASYRSDRYPQDDSRHRRDYGYDRDVSRRDADQHRGRDGSRQESRRADYSQDRGDRQVTRTDRDRDSYNSHHRSPPSRYNNSRRPYSSYGQQRRGPPPSAVTKDFKSTATNDMRGSRVTSTYSKFKGVSDAKLAEGLRDAIRTEWHHIDEIERNSEGEVVNLVWGAAFLNPTEKRRAPGGTAVLHHKCRRCKRVALHLLGVPRTPDRYCLACDGHADVPKWYFE